MIWGVTWAVSVFGASAVIKYYGIPWLEVTHWFIMITYLHHTTPDLPHYRKSAWNFTRGAAATVDRNFLGWQGRFFLHDVAHFHVIHHFFPKMPFCRCTPLLIFLISIPSHSLLVRPCTGSNRVLEDLHRRSLLVLG
jgi:fatty acid desaturase